MNLPFLPPKKILSLDLGSYEIKLVEGKSTKDGIVIDNYFSIPTPEDAYIDGKILDKDLIYYILNQEINNRKIKTKNVYLSINSSLIITREVIIPKVEEEEIENILKYQIEDYIPMYPKDYIVQFKTIGPIYEEGIEKLNILLIAIPKNIVENHFQLIKDLDLNPLILDYQPNSVAKLIKNNTLNHSYSIDSLTCSTVDLGYDSTKIAIIRDGNIMVSRIIDMGMKHIDQNISNFFNYNKRELEERKAEIENITYMKSEDDDYNKLLNIIKSSLENLNDRIEMVFRYYLTRERGNEINTILLYGGGSKISGISDFFVNYFNIPSIVIQSFDNVKFDGEIHKYINSIGTIIRNIEV
ncbi:MAG: type IV pilus assembly protein PilM [Tissierellia bacterium]|nr:type IV pilus assembly protein PilM [Tissierellia bacterium]